MEKYLTVSQLTKYISRKFQYDPYLEKIYLKGELSNYNPRRKGIQYFNLKDEHSILSAIMFQNHQKNLKFQPEDGMSVLVTGRVSVYEPQGRYQITIETMEPDGLGALYLAFEQTKEKLAKEGLFDPTLKQSIPKYPKRIGVVTSPSGAVIQDILTTVKRRYPIAEVVLFPTVVQGEASAASIVQSIKKAEEKGNIDTLIIGRGGGSFEDLFSFNEEIVVRAIAETALPVISSVGHETDTTLTDMVADLRAPTPTAAAEMAVPVLTEELLRLDEYGQRLIRAFQTGLQQASAEYSKLMRSIIFRQPERLYDGYLQKVDQLEGRLLTETKQKLQIYQNKQQLIEQRLTSLPLPQLIKEQKTTVNYLVQDLEDEMTTFLQEKNYQLAKAIQALEHLSPLTILARGYAVVEKNGQLLRSVKDVDKKDMLKIRLQDGLIQTQVEEVEIKEKK